MPELNCDPGTLAESAKCYCYPDSKTRDGVMIYLLNQISGLNLPPATLAQNARCYCYEPEQAEAVIAYLLCAIANK